MKRDIRLFSMLVLFCVAGFINEAWAGNVKYYIVNKSGATPVYEIRSHNNEGESLLIPNELKSPYIKDGGYRYFATPEAAQAYILEGTITDEVTTYSSSLTEVYVGYYYDTTYTPEGMPKLGTSTDATRYHVQFGGNFMFLEYKTNNDYHINPKVEEGNNVVRDTASVIMQFMFVSDKIDPYDIKIVTPFRPDGWMHSVGNALNSNDQFRFDKPTTTSLQESFFFTKNGDDLAIGAIYDSWQNNANDVQLAYLTKSGNVVRLGNTASIGDNQRITLSPLSLFHIVKKDGSIGISAYSNHKSLSDGLPSSIKSPVLKEEQYQYFRTKEAAQRYTATKEIDAEQHLEKDADITPGQVIYVGYDFKNDTTVVDLSGTRWYHIRGDYGNDKLYFSKETKDGNQSRPGLIAYTKENLESLFAENYEYTMFRFEGNDPYDIVVRNGFQEYPRYVFSNGSGAKHQLRVTEKDQDSKAVHLMLLPHVNGYHTLATFVDENSPNRIGHGADQYGGTKEDPGYLKMWCRQGNDAYMSSYNIPNNNNVAGSSIAPQPCYFSLETYAQLTFEPVQFETTFYIKDKTGRVAISYTGMFDADMPLNYENLPAAIRSPYLKNETLTFTDESGIVIERTPLTKGAKIYVTYTTDHLTDNPITLNNTDIVNYNLIVNGTYAYEEGGAVKGGTEENVDNNYLWNLVGEDPYAVQIRNVNVSDKVLTYNADNGSLGFGNDSYFILLGGKNGNTYEIMAATGDDAAEKHYNIGCTNGNIGLNENKEQVADEIQISLEAYKPGATYHIIDKQNKEVLSYYIENTILKVPNEIASPLVAKYHYWKIDAFDLDNATKTYVLKDGQTEITTVSEATVNKQTDIYVTYDCDDVRLSTSAEIEDGCRTMYRLAFSNVASYLYANEEIKLDLLGEEEFDADAKSSAITRTNWGWYFESDLKDPYHVKIASAAENESWNEGDRLYLYTSTEDGKTGAIIKKDANIPTDYMLLGADGAYQLVVMIDSKQHIVKSFGEKSIDDGAFDITELILQPTLILLDRHGWEIMRKPIPLSPDEDGKEEKYNDIRPYDSPMVKAYRFYRPGKKVKGYHKFEVSEPITVAGVPYTSTSLTELPPYYSADNLWEVSKSGVVNRKRVVDMYVVYDVKEEYEKTYQSDAVPYLIQQGGKYAKSDDGKNITAIDELPDVDDISEEEEVLWYIKPNNDIDKEMGYTGDAIEYDANSNGFDPYNLQIQNVKHSSYFTTNANGAKVGETAGMIGTYSSGDMTVTLTDLSTKATGKGQGNVTLNITNATFMVVQDENGNMRLMPRFDHAHRVENFTTLATPATAEEPNDQVGKQTTLFQRLLMYTYIIVDNSGHEALRYRGKVGEEYPQIPEKFKSPMAKDFKFYKDFERLNNVKRTLGNNDIEFYGDTYSLDNIAEKEITGSFIASDIYGDNDPIFVRYSYDKEGDKDGLLSKGDWQFVKVNEKNIQQKNDGNVETGTLPTDTEDELDEWKFKYIHNTLTDEPDPYNITIFNRKATTSDDTHYAFLSHGDNGLALIVTRRGDFEYYFLGDNSGKIEHIEESDFAINGTFKENQSKITFEKATFNSPRYYIITNDGVLALVAKSAHKEASEPALLPEWARSPLLNEGDYMYYTNAQYDEEAKTYSVDETSRINNLCGLPQDIVYVRYNYNKETCPLMVADTWVRKGETWSNINYSTLDITGGTWYNMEYDFLHYSGGFVPSLIQSRDGNGIYYESRDRDQKDVTDVDKKGYTLDFSRDSITGYIGVQSSDKFMFRLDGGDPYAIKIYNLYKYNQHKETEYLLSIYQDENESQLMYFLEKDKGYQSFMLLQKENDKKESRQLLVATGHPNFYVKLRANDDNPNFAFKVLSRTGDDADMQEESGDLLEELLTYDDVSAMRFYKAPSIGYYTFHGIRYNDDGTAPYFMDENGKPKVTWTSKLRRSWLTQVKMEEDLVRLYALYEKENTTNEFVSSSEAGKGRFYSDQDLTEPVYDKANRTDNIYPQIEKGDDYDIYFKYVVVSEDLDTLTSTLEDVAKDVEIYFAEDSKKGKFRKGQVNAKWSFMVLDTDENITTNEVDGKRTSVGQQYFIYRKDDGKVGWMDNDYSLHKESVDNYNNWSYHRLAEWYKQGDNDAFREGRWLWTFIGDDPYNIKLLNLETVVGVSPEAEGVYSLPKSEECYTIVTEETDAKGNKTYPVSIPLSKPTANYTFGLCPGYGTENTFSLQLPVTDSLCNTLYWKMATDNVKTDSVVGLARQNDRSNAIRLLKYVPIVYEDVNLTIRRIDEVKEYLAGHVALNDMVTGISKLYFAESERMFAAGDVIDMSNMGTLPANVKRAFCDYTFYSNKFGTVGGTYTVTAGPYPNYNEPLKDKYGTVLRDEDGKIIYQYYYDEAFTQKADGAQSIYASYEVTSDIFLKNAPTQEELAEMVDNNDHVYFMDFPELNKNEVMAYNTGHHAYFDKHATFEDQVGASIKSSGTGVTEKKKWDKSTKKFVNDNEQIYNYCQFKTTDNRMTAAPENLKWYFVGDPYKVQVYCTAGAWGSNEDKENPQIVAANLCRFDETETNFQFVVDCVHLRVPDYSNIDEREEVTPTDEDGHPLDYSIPNRGYNRPYYDDFYWEVVPAASGESGAFALRFKEDNDLLGYRNVYYYLAHDGLTKMYRNTGENKVYRINLSYNPDNEQYQSGDYAGYHTANDKNTAIKLTQPVKVYVSAKKSASNQITTDELSEYFGHGETLKEVPRHLQRKFVSYSTVNLPLDDTHTTLHEACKHKDNVFVSNPNDGNWIYKISVTYSLNDITDSGQHLFTSEQDFKDGTTINWLDVTVGGNWLYYDKLGGESETDKLSNYKSAIGSNGNGWKDGLKGLHWAFIGDPYDFVILNRRQYADYKNTNNVPHDMYLAAVKQEPIPNFKEEKDSVIWTTRLQETDAMTPSGSNDHTSTSTSEAEVNTHWSLQMWKTGGDADFFLRTASLKTTTDDFSSNSKAPNINQTNNYWRMVSKQYNDSDPVSAFNLVPYSLTDRDRYNTDHSSQYYSQTMNGLGATEQRIEIHTVTDMDKDEGDNDCFDATVRVVSEAGDVRVLQDGLEISYGKAVDMMPKSLRRFGCTYKCYIDYVDATNRGIEVTDFKSTSVLKDGNTFKQLLKEYLGKEDGEPITLTYVYTVTDSVAQFFTSEEDALMDEFIWLYSYFQWMQSYSGTNVEVERTRKVFDHYVYNSEGLIIDEVWVEEKYIEIVSNPSESVQSSSYLNTHGQQSSVYGDESTQSDEDRLKWSLVGDPYDFTMKNYAQYLNNPNSSTFVDENGNVISSNTDDTHLTIIIDEDGKPHLAIVDSDGNFIDLITFDYNTTSDKSLHTATGSGPNTHDPTGNSINIKDAKEFWLTSLIRFADLVTYHLVMAHQHSLDYKDEFKDVTEDKVASETDANKKKLEDDLKKKKDVENRLYEFLKYWGIHFANDANHYFNEYKGDTLIDKTALVKKLLKEKGTLRNFIHYPIADAEATRVGIGNRPTVPWYMKRQFCTYTLYQRDIQQTIQEMIPADDEWIKNGGKTITGEDGKEYRADDEENPIYTIKWVSIFDVSSWSDWTENDGDEALYEVEEKDVTKWGNGLVKGQYKAYPSGYWAGKALQGRVINRLEDCHRNRKVVIDVLYEVSPDKFRFATRGRNTTAWYQMMNTISGGKDVLMNFSYLHGIGSQEDRTQHYTNDYLWAPQGDPYGFVMHSRYATINGTGWDDVVVTTTGKLPKGKEGDNIIYIDNSGNTTDYELIKKEFEEHPEKLHATYTGSASSHSTIKFDDNRIGHWRTGDEVNGETVATDGASNAIYEMFTGNTAYTNSFIMHPTSAWLDDDDADRLSYYLTVDTKEDESNNIELTYGTLTELKNNPNANWQLTATAEQLLPYFDRAGYVGGLDPAKAQNFSNVDIRTRLREHVTNQTEPEYTLLSQAQEVVYDGTFKDNAGTVVAEGTLRPADDLLPMTFESTNLINMKDGYYRIKAFSEDALNSDESSLVSNKTTEGEDGTATTVRGIVGPRYISGYRFDSEKGNVDVKANTDDSETNTAESKGKEPLKLHFFETNMDNATIHTFGKLTETISDVPSRTLDDHKSMKGNIDILPADFDPSSIFQFTKNVINDKNDSDGQKHTRTHYTMKTQGLDVYAKPGNAATQDKEDEGKTLMSATAPTDDTSNSFRVDDIGGTAMTFRIEAQETGDWNDLIAGYLKTNYLSADEEHYNITCNIDNEMHETQTGVQTTKWLLQPVGIKEDWPYNETPLRVEVKKGGVDARDENKEDPYYYGSLYVPFDTRMGNTIDGAFTVTTNVTAHSNILSMPSVSQSNGIGNPQYVPAEWPVILRTNSPKAYEYDDGDINTKHYTKHYVNMYLPYNKPQHVKDPGIKLKGSYLEKVLTKEEIFTKEEIDANNVKMSDKTIMVFGVPFSDHEQHAYNREKKPVGLYTNDNWWREEAPDSETTTANHEERNNKYVYHNKVYYILDEPYTAPKDDTNHANYRSIVTIFDTDEAHDDEDEEQEYLDTDTSTPWPCSVYDLQGRRVARKETPETLRANHPNLPKGVYIFGHKKVVVK